MVGFLSQKDGARPSIIKPEPIVVQEEREIGGVIIVGSKCLEDVNEADRLAKEGFENNQKAWEEWCRNQGGSLVFSKGSSGPTRIPWERKEKTFIVGEVKVIKNWLGDPIITRQPMTERVITYQCVEYRRSAKCVASKVIQLQYVIIKTMKKLLFFMLIVPVFVLAFPYDNPDSPIGLLGAPWGGRGSLPAINRPLLLQLKSRTTGVHPLLRGGVYGGVGIVAPVAKLLFLPPPEVIECWQRNDIRRQQQTCDALKSKLEECESVDDQMKIIKDKIDKITNRQREDRINNPSAPVISKTDVSELKRLNEELQKLKIKKAVCGEKYMKQLSDGVLKCLEKLDKMVEKCLAKRNANNQRLWITIDLTGFWLCQNKCMSDNKFNYVVGIALVVLLVLVVYLGGRVKTMETDLYDLYGRVSDLEAVLDLSSVGSENLGATESDLQLPEDENLGGYALDAFDDYYDYEY